MLLLLPTCRWPGSHLPLGGYLCWWGLGKTVLKGQSVIVLMDGEEVKFWPYVSKNNWCYDWAQVMGHSCWIRAEQSAWATHLLVSFWEYRSFANHLPSFYDTVVLYFSWTTSLGLFPDFWGPLLLTSSFYCYLPPSLPFNVGVFLVSPRGASFLLLSPEIQLSSFLAFELIAP